MNNKLVLIISGVTLMAFFVAGLLDIMYDWNILDNLVSQIILIGTFLALVAYLVKVNLRKKNLPKSR